MGFLVISRKLNETVTVGDVKVKIVKIESDKIDIAIEAPKHVKIDRGDDKKVVKRRYGHRVEHKFR